MISNSATATPGDEARDKLAVVDVDVHHGIQNELELKPYLPKVYQQRLVEYGFGGSGNKYSQNGGVRGWRGDLTVDEIPARATIGGSVAWDVDATREQLLDACGIDIAVLTGATVYDVSGMPDLDYASALCRAFNDWTLEHWASADPRFRVTVAICTQDPDGAAKEIDRLGDNPAVCGVLMPGGGLRPFGHRSYLPIYEACERHGLPVAIHFGAEGGGVFGPLSAAGYPSYYIETRLLRPSFYQVHLGSYIFEGVFERFPELRVVMLESGISWVPAHLWRMDADWKALRWHTPWVKKLPSEYVIENIRFASQPLDDPDTREGLAPLLEWMHADRTLMFSSDYPHWDWDDPTDSLTDLSPELRTRVFSTNARETFRF